MTPSERTCQEDLIKILKYVEPIKDNGTLNFEFPAILLPKKQRLKIRLLKNYIVVKCQIDSIKTEKFDRK